MTTSNYDDKSKHLLEQAEALMQERMAQNDPSHDVNHVLRVHRSAVRIARCLPASLVDIWLVEMAAYLHDINDHKYAPSSAATAKLDQILDGMDEDKSRELRLILENVSWSTERRKKANGTWGDWEEHSLELHCVQDADRLDSIGAFGIMRCAAYSAVANRPLYLDDPTADTAISHFHDKLLKVYPSLKTELGKKMGARRHQLMLDFIQGVEEESGTSNPP